MARPGILLAHRCCGGAERGCFVEFINEEAKQDKNWSATFSSVKIKLEGDKSKSCRTFDLQKAAK